jgi:hypothetical protein
MQRYLIRFLFIQETDGGYTGNDLTAFAKQLGVTERGLRILMKFKQKKIC